VSTPELLALAENYLSNNAAESGADRLIRELVDHLRLAQCTSMPSRDAIARIIADTDLEERARYVQGFTYFPQVGEPYHVVRDVMLPADRQELSRTTDRGLHDQKLAEAKAGFAADAIRALATIPEERARTTSGEAE
jgi:hypothetical protein